MNKKSMRWFEMFNSLFLSLCVYVSIFLSISRFFFGFSSSQNYVENTKTFTHLKIIND